MYCAETYIKVCDKAHEVPLYIRSTKISLFSPHFKNISLVSIYLSKTILALNKAISFTLAFFISICSFAQPFVDVLSLNHQRLQTKTESDSFIKHFNNSYVGITLPIRVDSNNYFIVRANGEMLNSNVKGHGHNSSVNIKMMLLGIGWQHTFNQHWSVSGLLLPKIASELKDQLASADFQFGGSLVVNYKVRRNYRFKAGIYYNREPFGNFFVPLVGADIELNKNNWIYGQLPLYFRYEHRFNKKLYSGLGVRIFGRSYRLSSDYNRNYVFLQENQIKLFCDYYLAKNLVLFAEIGRTMGYGLRQYKNNTQRTGRIYHPSVLSPVQDGFMINLGIALRVRRDF